jgi:hypothetical protein
MNQRIRELALEAGEYVNSVYTPPVRSNTPGKIWEDGHVDWHTQFNQKFAELIVSECIQVSEAHAKDLESQPTDPLLEAYDDGIVNGIYEATEAIKEHFGVE